MNNLSEKSIFSKQDNFSVHFQLYKKTFFGMNQKTFFEETEHPERGNRESTRENGTGRNTFHKLNHSATRPYNTSIPKHNKIGHEQ